VKAEALVIPAPRSAGMLTLRFGAAPGPFNVPLLLRATLATAAGPVTAETKIDVAAEK
jgi:hypothetical protein